MELSSGARIFIAMDPSKVGRDIQFLESGVLFIIHIPI
jgi:hypothetical protein